MVQDLVTLIMALIKCKECKKEISSDAKQCPGCGYKKKETSWLFIAFVIFLILGAIGSLFGDKDKGETGTKKLLSEKRYENATQSQKNCVNTFGQGVYKDKSLTWKLDNCNVPE